MSANSAFPTEELAFDFAVGPFTVRLTRDPQWVRAAQRLRYEVFNLELKEGLADSQATGLDQDRYDEVCDHLLVVDQRADLVVGTYRLLPQSRRQLHGFYSETEFDLSPLDRFPGRILELGRSCVHKDYRTGMAMRLLWGGIGHYVDQAGFDLLLGCASVHTTEGSKAMEVYQVLRPTNLAPEALRCLPRPENDLLRDAPAVEVTDAEAVKEGLSPLFKGYLRLGSYIGGRPAFDPLFRCFDFLILLDTHGEAAMQARAHFRGRVGG